MPLVSSGVEHGNLRELALARLDDWGSRCRDIRTREVGIQEIHHRVRPYEVLLHADNVFHFLPSVFQCCLLDVWPVKMLDGFSSLDLEQ